MGIGKLDGEIDYKLYVNQCLSMLLYFFQSHAFSFLSFSLPCLYYYCYGPIVYFCQWYYLFFSSNSDIINS